MSSNNESIGKTLSVVVALCLVCAVIVSFASVQLRPLQQANKTQDIQRNILAAAGVAVSGSVSDTFNSKIEARVVDMNTGEFVEGDHVRVELGDEGLKFTAVDGTNLEQDEQETVINDQSTVESEVASVGD